MSLVGGNSTYNYKSVLANCHNYPGLQSPSRFLWDLLIVSSLQQSATPLRPLMSSRDIYITSKDNGECISPYLTLMGNLEVYGNAPW